MQPDELERHLVESASQPYCETNVTIANKPTIWYVEYIPGTNERLRRRQDVLVGRSVHFRRTAPQADGPVLLHGGPYHNGLGFLHAGHGILGRELGSSPELPTSGRKITTVSVSVHNSDSDSSLQWMVTPHVTPGTDAENLLVREDHLAPVVLAVFLGVLLPLLLVHPRQQRLLGSGHALEAHLVQQTGSLSPRWAWRNLQDMTGHDEREFQMCEIAYPESEARWAIAEGGHHLCVQGLGQLAGPPEWVLVRQAVQGVEISENGTKQCGQAMEKADSHRLVNLDGLPVGFLGSTWPEAYMPLIMCWTVERDFFS